MDWPGQDRLSQNGTVVLMLTGGSPQPDVSPCIRIAGSGLGFGQRPTGFGKRRRRSLVTDGWGWSESPPPEGATAADHVFSSQEVDRYGLLGRLEEAATFGLR